MSHSGMSLSIPMIRSDSFGMNDFKPKDKTYGPAITEEAICFALHWHQTYYLNEIALQIAR